MSVSAQLNQIKSRAADFLFPPHCLGCGREGDFLCVSCSRTLPRLMPPLCSQCGRPLVGEEHCSVCQKLQMTINGISSPFLFEGMMRQAIHQLKYYNFKALAFPLARLLAEYWESVSFSVDTIVPVPLHARRLRERGYNQSGLLAQELGRLITCPVVDDSLLRRGNTQAQVKATDAEQRRKNVHDVFTCCNDEGLAGKKVLLIDDVCTTGATLDSCAVALNKVGAASVWGLTLAREI